MASRGWPWAARVFLLEDLEDFCLPDFVAFVPLAAGVDGFSFVGVVVGAFSFFPIASRYDFGLADCVFCCSLISVIGGVKFSVTLTLPTAFSSFFVIVLSENSILIDDDGVWTFVYLFGTLPNGATRTTSL